MCIKTAGRYAEQLALVRSKSKVLHRAVTWRVEVERVEEGVGQAGVTAAMGGDGARRRREDRECIDFKLLGDCWQRDDCQFSHRNQERFAA